MKFSEISRNIYSKQQSSMVDFKEIITPVEIKPEKKTEPKKVQIETPKKQAEIKQNSVNTIAKPVQEKPQIDWETILAPVKTGVSVKHKKFGIGKITWMDNARKYMRISFNIDNMNVEKSFVFPDAFINGFLTLTEE